MDRSPTLLGVSEFSCRDQSIVKHSKIRVRDNGYDHRAGTINLNFKKHAQVRLRVHHIVIPRLVASFAA